MSTFLNALVLSLFVVVTGTFSSCNSGHSKNLLHSNTDFASHQSKASTNSLPFFAGRLESFESSDGHYVSLYFKEGVEESVFQVLDAAKRTVLFTGDEEIRSSLSRDLIESHFITSGLEKLILLDSFQNVVETLSLSNYEYLESTIGSSYVASYQTKKESQGLQVVSLEAFEKRPLSKAPEFASNTKSLNTVLSKNNLKPDYTYFHGCTTHENHRYMLISFVNYARHANAVYLFKDGIPTDSIIQNYCLFDFKPIPLTTNEKAFYTAHGGIPETDALWYQLFEINWKKGSLSMHERNRFQL